jgi:hypothetical protein
LPVASAADGPGVARDRVSVGSLRLPRSQWHRVPSVLMDTSTVEAPARTDSRHYVAGIT